jgi:hypothetical protein
MSEFSNLCAEVAGGKWPTLGPQPFRKANFIALIPAHLARVVPTEAERQAARREAFNHASKPIMAKAMAAFNDGTIDSIEVAAILARVHRTGDRVRS